jgi:hypothetical protein
MWRIGLAAAAVALSGPAWGQAGLDPVLERLAAQGYGGFEIEREGGTVKVEAVRNGVQRELVYDAGTGRLVEDSMRPTGGAGSADDNGGRIDRDDRTEAGDDRDARGASSNERDDDSRGRGSDDDDDHGGRGGDDSGADDSGGHGGRGGDDDSSGRGGRGGDDDSHDDDHGGRGGDDSGGRGGRGGDDD